MSYIRERNNIARQMGQLIRCGDTKYNVPVSCKVSTLKSMQLLSNKMNMNDEHRSRNVPTLTDLWSGWYHLTGQKVYKYKISHKFHHVRIKLLGLSTRPLFTANYSEDIRGNTSRSSLWKLYHSFNLTEQKYYFQIRVRLIASFNVIIIR